VKDKMARYLILCLVACGICQVHLKQYTNYRHKRSRRTAEIICSFGTRLGELSASSLGRLSFEERVTILTQNVDLWTL